MIFKVKHKNGKEISLEFSIDEFGAMGEEFSKILSSPIAEDIILNIIKELYDKNENNTRSNYNWNVAMTNLRENGSLEEYLKKAAQKVTNQDIVDSQLNSIYNFTKVVLNG